MRLVCVILLNLLGELVSRTPIARRQLRGGSSSKSRGEGGGGLMHVCHYRKEWGGRYEAHLALLPPPMLRALLVINIVIKGHLGNILWDIVYKGVLKLGLFI